MLQSGHRSGTSPRGDPTQPFASHPANLNHAGRDGGNMVGSRRSLCAEAAIPLVL